MRIRRKIIASLLILAILSPFIPNLVTHASTPIFSLQVNGVPNATAIADVGETFSVDVNLSDGLENQKMVTVMLGYDPAYLEPVPDVDNGTEKTLITGKSLNADIAPGYIVATGLIGTNDVTMSFVTPAGIAKSGRVATVTFKVIQQGDTQVGITSASYCKDPESPDAELNKPVTIPTVSVVNLKNPVPMTGLIIQTPSILMNKGGGKVITAEKQPANTTNTDRIIWTTSNSAVVTVNDGHLAAVGPGTATITAKCSGFEATAEVEVRNPLTGVTVNEKELNLSKGDKYQLVAERVPADTTSTSRLSWVSLDNKVVTVDQTGLVTAVGTGTTEVKVSCGAFSKSVKIYVTAPLLGISFDSDDIAIDLGGKTKLNLIKDPIDTTDTTPTEWSSSDESIVTVDENGQIEGIAQGRAVVTAKVGSFKAMISVIVNAHIESIEIINDAIDENRNIELYKGQSTELSVVFKPDVFVEARTIKWSTNADNIVKIENGVITALAPGQAKIKAETVNKITDEITVTVPYVNAQKLVIDKNELALEKGEAVQLNASILPENTTDDKTVKWKSLDGSIASVDENGVVTAKGTGFTTIVASAAGLTATCPVTVTCSLTDITLNHTEILADVGVPVVDVLKVTKVPADATIDESETIWRSLNETVATVNNGIITAVGPGTAVIEAELGGRIARCKVVVDVQLTGVEIEYGDTPLELKVGQMSKLNPVFLPANVTKVPIPEWTTSDENIVTVDSKGLIEAKSEGQAEITVDYGNGIKASRIVKVQRVHADSIIFDKKIETLIKGEEAVLVAKLVPEQAVDEISWSSSDESIATVDQAGNVKAIKSGKVKITATSSNGKSATMEITVKEAQLEFVTLTLEKTELKEGETTKSTVTFNPETITDDVTITYSSSNESMATVDNFGVVTAKKAGEVIITVDVIAINDSGDEKGFSSQVDLTIIEVPTTDGQIDPDKETTGDNDDKDQEAEGDKENSDTTNPEENKDPSNEENKDTETPKEENKEETKKPTTGTTTQQKVESLVTSPHTGDMNIKALAVMMLVSIVGMFTRFKTIDLIINK